MKVVFVTTQSYKGSTLIGRVLPIARQIRSRHDLSVLALGTLEKEKGIKMIRVGREPFERTEKGKVKLKGLNLIVNMLWTAVNICFALAKINPEVVIICKPLPHNVLGVKIWKLFNKRSRIILDVDDFELEANQLSSLRQRAAIHWSERQGSKMADQIVVASNFLGDHFKQLNNADKRVMLIPTGVRARVYQSNRKTKKYLVGYVGSVSLSSGHRVDMIPEIIKRLNQHVPSFKVLIAGGGDDIEQLKAKLKQEGLSKQVDFIGRFEPDEGLKLIDLAKIVIDPVDSSIANRAKSTFRVLAAIELGLPIVTSDIGIRSDIIPECIKDRAFAKPGDSRSYVNKIVDWINNPLIEEEKKAMQRLAIKFSWRKLGKQYDKIINDG